MKLFKKFIILMTVVVQLKKVKVKTRVFKDITSADSVRKYIEDCVATGSAYLLYADPVISAAFYGEGITAAGNIRAAINNYTPAPTEANRKTIGVCKKEGILWLEKYSEKVEDIANSDANRATRQAAFTNILHSFLTPFKLESATKGIPETPKLAAEIIGANLVKVKITNGEVYNPSQTNFIMVQLPSFTTAETPDPLVELKEGQLTFNDAAGEIITKSLSGKRKSTIINFKNTGKRYAVYAYVKNGNKLVSSLSTVIIVKT